MYSIGIGVPFASTSNVVGVANQTSIGTRLHVRLLPSSTTRTRTTSRRSSRSRKASSASILRTRSALPVQKTIDRLRFDLLYTRFMESARWPIRSFRVADEPVRVERARDRAHRWSTKQFLDGTETTELIAANDDFQVSEAFAPVLLREGFGANFRLVRSRVVSLDWRAGFGFRQNQYNGAFVQEVR